MCRLPGSTPGAETPENSPSVPADTVLGTTPEGGTAAEAGSSVDFRISSGLVTLTDLTGQTLGCGILDTCRPRTCSCHRCRGPIRRCESQPGSPVTQQSLAPGDVPQRSEVDADLLRRLSAASAPATSGLQVHRGARAHPGSPATASQLPSMR